MTFIIKWDRTVLVAFCTSFYRFDVVLVPKLQPWEEGSQVTGGDGGDENDAAAFSRAVGRGSD